MRTRRFNSSPGETKSRYISPKLEKSFAMQFFHQDVIKKTNVLIGHTFFEIVCQAPPILELKELEEYALSWVDKGWSASIVSTGFSNGKSHLSLRLRSYIDTFPY